MKIYLGWGAFLEHCEFLLPDISLAIEKETGEPLEVEFDYSDKALLGEFPDEYLYALKRVGAHIQKKGQIPKTSFIEDLLDEEIDETLAEYIDRYQKGFKFGSLIFFSETLGVYLPVKGLEEPLHFEHEEKTIEICSVGSLYTLKRDLEELRKLLEEKRKENSHEEVPWHIELQLVDKLLQYTERAIKENKPLILVGED